MNGNLFLDYVEQVLVPILAASDNFVFDQFTPAESADHFKVR